MFTFLRFFVAQTVSDLSHVVTSEIADKTLKLMVVTFAETKTFCGLVTNKLFVIGFFIVFISRNTEALPKMRSFADGTPTCVVSEMTLVIKC